MSEVCSPQEIERKRLLALEKKKESQLKVKNQNNVSNNIKSDSSSMKQYNVSNYSNSQQKIKSKMNQYQRNKTHPFNAIKTETFFNKTLQIIGNCYMVSSNKFTINVKYHSQMIDIFKTIPSKLYDAKTKMWQFDLKDYDLLIQKLIQIKSDIKIIPIPTSILKIFKKNLEEKSNNFDLSQIDENLVSALMPFQREGISYGISKNGRCIIADDMGLGKTIQALGIAHYFKESWPLLIVTPSSVRFQWSEAIFKFLPSIPVHLVRNFTNSKDIITLEKIVITSYDLLVRHIDTLQKYIFGCIIVDESHILKNSKTARFKAVQTMVSNAHHVILLSGTPALSRPMELYPQIKLILPRFIECVDFGVRYCAGVKRQFGWDFSGSSNMQELQLLLNASCMIRRLKSDVLNQLPKKLREIVILDPEMIKTGTKEMQTMSTKIEKINGKDKYNAILEYYNISSFARQKAVCNYICDILEKEQKFLVFAHHKNVIDNICDLLRTKKIRHIKIDGRTSPELRKQNVDEFQEKDDCLVAVLSITAANAGITLTAAQLVIFAELFWNPGILCQAEDRVHRIGQNSSVLIQYLIGKNTADDHLWPLIQKKLSVLNEVGLNQNFSFDDAQITNQTVFKNERLAMSDFLNTSSNQETKNSTSQKVDESDVTIKNDIEFDDLELCDWDNI